MIYCAQPNQRLKLAAPVPDGSRERFTFGVVEFPCEHSSSAPQLKRASLDGAIHSTRTHVWPLTNG